MNEVQLRTLLERHTYLTELEDRKSVVLKSIEEVNKTMHALAGRLREWAALYSVERSSVAEDPPVLAGRILQGKIAVKKDSIDPSQEGLTPLLMAAQQVLDLHQTKDQLLSSLEALMKACWNR